MNLRSLSNILFKLVGETLKQKKLYLNELYDSDYILTKISDIHNLLVYSRLMKHHKVIKCAKRFSSLLRNQAPKYSIHYEK